MNKKEKAIKVLLDRALENYAHAGFIDADPIQIPHRFTLKQDIEIAGLFAALFAWGQRKTIIAKCTELMQRMDNAPYDFVLNHSSNELKSLESFVHRTFNGTDLLYTIDFLQRNYTQFESLEEAFVPSKKYKDSDTGEALRNFHSHFTNSEYFPKRTEKHIASPAKGSSCKRLNMYLRWMCRTNAEGIDFQLWNKIKPHQLVCPLDVHVMRVSEKIGLCTFESNAWGNAIKLSNKLKQFDPQDPIKYDLALFSLGADGLYK